jgi:RNA polymerase sigma factor (sigma-70 family)
LLIVYYIETKNDMDDVSAKRLYEQYGFLIYRTCLRILHSEDDAKDALQSVFVKLLESYGAINDPGKVVPWIFSAAKNHCFNILRSRKKFAQAVEMDELPSSEDCGKVIESRDIIRLIFKNQAKKVRDAAYYTYVEHFDQREIKKLTGQSPATIRRNLAKFKKSLSSLGKMVTI